MNQTKEYRYNYKGYEQGHYVTDMNALFSTICQALKEGKTIEVRHWKTFKNLNTAGNLECEPSGKRHIVHIFAPEGISLRNEMEDKQ